VFRQLFEPQPSTYTDLLAEGRAGKAILTNPVFEQITSRRRVFRRPPMPWTGYRQMYIACLMISVLHAPVVPGGQVTPAGGAAATDG
jgi:hypothetical protein